MTTIPFLERDHGTEGCYRNRIHELAEQCDNEYYMSANPTFQNKERTRRGRSRMIEGLEEFNQLFVTVTCTVCCEEIERQIFLQREGLQEIDSFLNQ